MVEGVNLKGSPSAEQWREKRREKRPDPDHLRRALLALVLTTASAALRHEQDEAARAIIRRAVDAGALGDIKSVVASSAAFAALNTLCRTCDPDEGDGPRRDDRRHPRSALQRLEQALNGRRMLVPFVESG